MFDLIVLPPLINDLICNKRPVAYPAYISDGLGIATSTYWYRYFF